MARLFDDASSQYLEAASAVLTAAPLTISIWVYSDDLTITQTAFEIGNGTTANNQFGLRLAGLVAGDPIRYQVRSSSPAVAVNIDTTTGYSSGVWHHLLAYSSAANDHHVFIDGGSEGSSSTSCTPVTPTKTTIAARIDGTARDQYMSGGAAEAAIWNVALSASEIAILAKGYSPLLIRPASLMFYAPLIRDSDRDIRGGLALAPSGSPTIGVHPRVFYPSSPIKLGVPAAAAPAGNPWYAYAQQ